eukprot:Selendium_serpulae@DN3938_c0_g1_i1.p3
MNMLRQVGGAQSANTPASQMAMIMSFLLVKSLVQGISASIAEMVPPLIPPPFWIMRPLPCMPMLLGRNCLGSVLYPVTMPDFIQADTTDSVMNGIMASFPQKYLTRVGKTSDEQYI